MTMKYIFILTLIFSYCGINGQKNDDVLLKVGNTEVKVSEFRYIYEKNNGSTADYSAKSINDYLELYTKFKLKVAKAKQIKLDTISALITELDGYRRQLASSYLIDKEVTDFLLRELFDRLKYDVEFSHIFIPVPEGSAKSVKDEARNKLRDIKSRLVGGMPFEDAAREFSMDKTTAGRGGYMGYFTAKLPSGFYELESALYNTKVGQTSDIVESKIGLHLVKVTNKRPARGTIEVAHILVKQDQSRLIDSLYNELLKGKDFDMLALNYSIDKSSAKNGGKLPPFGINTYDRLFEDTAFSIENDGGFSKPISTSSGYHIIKKIKKNVPDTYELFIRRMKPQISKDQRFDAAKVKLISDIKKSAGFKEDKNELSRFAASLTDDFYSYKWSPDVNVSDKTLFTLAGNQIYKVKDFANFCRKNTKTRLKYDTSKPIAETIEELYGEFVNESALAFEEQTLEIKYPDFKALMREYEEGILLFEATKINVWDKANQDTVGLQQFYSLHHNLYFWPEKAKTLLISIKGADQKTAEKIYKYTESNSVEKVKSKFNKKGIEISDSMAEYEKGAKETGDIQWQKSKMTYLQKDNSGNSYSFRKILEILPSKEKTLTEARGYVVADYQDYLEKAWIKQLEKEFEVVIFKDVLDKLKK